jgi:two-component system chemotaxis response regulator CheY
MRFLVVDDDFETRRLVQKLLRPYGDVDVAMDGEEGVEAFSRSLKEGEPYSLITMDILMPNIDGQQALREIRQIEKERDVPPAQQAKIIMISGLDDSKEVHDAFFLGEATSYIVKPINHQVLLQEIEKLGVTLGAASQ